MRSKKCYLFFQFVLDDINKYSFNYMYMIRSEVLFEVRQHAYLTISGVVLHVFMHLHIFDFTSIFFRKFEGCKTKWIKPELNTKLPGTSPNGIERSCATWKRYTCMANS